MSPALNERSVIRCFERGDRVEIHDGIIFDFYTGLPHVHLKVSRRLIHTHLNFSEDLDMHEKHINVCIHKQHSN